MKAPVAYGFWAGFVLIFVTFQLVLVGWVNPYGGVVLIADTVLIAIGWMGLAP